jgi:putative transcriptional regulator
MIKQDFSNLTGKILIASPYTMEGNVFYQSIIYVIQHNKEGSVGLIINHPVNNSPVNNLFKKMDENIDFKNLNLEVHLGGPVEMERGFFLHTNEYSKNLLFTPIEDGLAVSSNTQIIKDISNGTGPKKSLFIIGYTGWAADQMEFELENNLWIVAEPNLNLIFDEVADEKWPKALSTLGISKYDFNPEIARC